MQGLTIGYSYGGKYSCTYWRGGKPLSQRQKLSWIRFPRYPTHMAIDYFPSLLSIFDSLSLNCVSINYDQGVPGIIFIQYTHHMGLTTTLVGVVPFSLLYSSSFSYCCYFWFILSTWYVVHGSHTSLFWVPFSCALSGDALKHFTSPSPTISCNPLPLRLPPPLLFSLEDLARTSNPLFSVLKKTMLSCVSSNRPHNGLSFPSNSNLQHWL